MKKIQKKAFTLVEMMIVVAIIAVLAGIAVPQYTKYVKKSEATEAIRFMKQIVDAQGIYYSTHNKYIANDEADDNGLKILGTEINTSGKFTKFEVDTCTLSGKDGFIIRSFEDGNDSADKSVYMFYPSDFEPNNYTANLDLYDGTTFLYNYINEEASSKHPSCN